MTGEDRWHRIGLIFDALVEAEHHKAAAGRAVAQRDAACGRLADLVGGDKLAAIHNGHLEIGRLMVGMDTHGER